MHDIFGTSAVQPSGQRTLNDYLLKRLILSPTHWATCSLPINLNWQVVQFKSANLASVPDDEKGVYSFVVKPGIVNHPACAVLLYVGQAQQQSFRKRFNQYLHESRAGDKARRIHVTEMLEKWDDYLWFCYASITDENLITQVEDSLLAAYLPPSNKDFPATVSHQIRKLFAQ